MKKLLLISLLILIGAQFAIPFRMIHDREEVLRKGELFRFKTRPIDPADPFQGRYVRLSFENNYIPCAKEDQSDLDYKTPVFVLLETNQHGFAQFSQMNREKPETDIYLKTRYRGNRRQWNSKTKKHTFLGDQIDIPFDRFYMDEAKAPRAEIIARDATRETNCWVNVRIYEGKAVIEDVFVKGESLRELAEKKDKK